MIILISQINAGTSLTLNVGVISGKEIQVAGV